MKIVHIALELAPILKVGGLADVVHGLSTELARQKHSVKVIVPLYGFLNKKNLGLIDSNEKFVVNEKKSWHNNQVFRKKFDGVEVIFIEMHHPEKYFSQKNIYGYENDIPRFIYFSRAALEFLLNEKKEIDILHLHDWHVSISSVIAKDILKEHGLKVRKIILTVHNFHYQGKCAPIDLENIGLNGNNYLKPDLLQDSNKKYPNSLNLLKGGINYSDAVTTVSKTYAEELLNNMHTYGLGQTIQEAKSKLIGILNGIDTDQWNPSTDNSLSCNFSKTQSSEEIVSKKAKNKQSLLCELSLQGLNRPLFIFIGRLVKQKGVELLEPIIEHILRKEGIFILCGSADDPLVQKHFEELKEKYKSSQQIHFHFDYNESLTRKMYGSSDFILVPSLFEPCGLVQLIAMSYGTIPIVRKTGGLNDSVNDIEETGFKNGIVFEKFNQTEFIKAIDRAFALYQKPSLGTLIKKIMQIDFSWEVSAKKYLSLYQKA